MGAIPLKRVVETFVLSGSVGSTQREVDRRHNEIYKWCVDQWPNNCDEMLTIVEEATSISGHRSYIYLFHDLAAAVIFKMHIR